MNMMEKPVVAIVGRPNVGKSTLFNRLISRRAAIVEDTPGVTRDRQYGDAVFQERPFICIDTGGFEPNTDDAMLKLMRGQAQLAMEEADVIVMVFDGQAGLTPADREIALMLMRSGKPVHFAVNKIDGVRHIPLTAEFWEVGMHELWPISAQHGGGVYELLEAFASDFEERPIEAQDGDELKGVLKIAVVGKPNAGKSTLLNRMLGEDRLLVNDQPGTTRDSIDTWLTMKDPENPEGPPKRYLMIDTAGVRRRKWISTAVEKISIVRTFKSIDRADVCLMLIDATEGVTDQDAKIARLVADKGKACVLLVNKWDAVPDKTEAVYGEAIKAVKSDLSFVDYAPILTISALSGQRTHKIMEQVERVWENANRRVPTAELNKVFEDLITRHSPPVHKHRKLKVFYATQVSVAPPTFVLWVNDPDALKESYARFLVNRFREHWDFEGTPVKLVARQRTGR